MILTFHSIYDYFILLKLAINLIQYEFPVYDSLMMLGNRIFIKTKYDIILNEMYYIHICNWELTIWLLCWSNYWFDNRRHKRGTPKSQEKHNRDIIEAGSSVKLYKDQRRLNMFFIQLVTELVIGFK